MKGLSGRLRHSAEALKHHEPHLFRKLVDLVNGRKVSLSEGDRETLTEKRFLDDEGKPVRGLAQLLEEIGTEVEPQR